MTDMTEEQKKAVAELNAKIGTPEFFGETKLDPLPVAGYTAQPQSKIDEVNINKRLEEVVLRRLDDMDHMDIGGPFIDRRWVQIARTHIEQGFMAANRAIFQPERVKIEE